VLHRARDCCATGTLTDQFSGPIAEETETRLGAYRFVATRVWGTVPQAAEHDVRRSIARTRIARSDCIAKSSERSAIAKTPRLTAFTRSVATVFANHEALIKGAQPACKLDRIHNPRASQSAGRCCAAHPVALETNQEMNPKEHGSARAKSMGKKLMERYSQRAGVEQNLPAAQPGHDERNLEQNTLLACHEKHGHCGTSYATSIVTF
jgi:hypothetical protein